VPVVTVDRDLENEADVDADSEFRAALNARRYDEARAVVERHASDPEFPGWLVTSMLEDIGLSLSHAGRHDEAIAAFERALELGWDVVPDGRCEIARVMLLAGRDAESDVLWADLRAADTDGVWTLNAGGLAYAQVGRDEEAVEWLAEGLRRGITREDPEHVVDQMSDGRRSSLRRLGRGLDDLELEVETFRARAAVRKQEHLSELRSAAKRAGIPVRGSSATIAWLTEAGYNAARARWPGWIESLNQDEPFDERRTRMERHLRQRRVDGDGPFLLVTIDLDHYAAWCAQHGYEPADRRSRGSFAESVRDAGGGRSWPPGRNEPCWCGSERKYKRCCGALASSTVGR
jgi:tetratricopeptide (TPR) repeat protein